MATVPVEITWVTGQVVTAAQLNANVRDAINFLLAPPMAELRQTVSQSIPSGGAVLLFDTEDLDRDNGHSTVTNTSRYTAQTTGWYAVGAGWISSGGPAGRRHVWWLVNGVSVNASEGGAYAGASSSTGGTGRARNIFLNIGDYAEVFAMQDTGSSVSTFAASGGQPGASLRFVST